MAATPVRIDRAALSLRFGVVAEPLFFDPYPYQRGSVMPVRISWKSRIITRAARLAIWGGVLALALSKGWVVLTVIGIVVVARHASVLVSYAGAAAAGLPVVTTV
jgi:hypothetical protein